jgi:glucosinolate gamma-glutamyl hydrolase
VTDAYLQYHSSLNTEEHPNNGGFVVSEVISVAAELCTSPGGHYEPISFLPALSSETSEFLSIFTNSHYLPEMGSLSPSRCLKIAVLINTDEAPYIPLFTSAYKRIFTTLSPTATLTFYSPPSHSLPSPIELSAYDLLIVGGGTYVVDESAPWVADELEFLKNTIRKFPELKIVAICFGHQKLCQAFGGELGWNKAGKAEVCSPSLPLLFPSLSFPPARNVNVNQLGITPLPLTTLGVEFFPFSSTATSTPSLKLHELHRKEVSKLAAGFLELAENNQICLSENRRILTFQGHPEMSAELARALMESESLYTKGLSKVEKRMLVEGVSAEHDGIAVWRQVLEWVGENSGGF